MLSEKINSERFMLCGSVYTTFWYGKILELEDKLVLAKDRNRREREGKGEREVGNRRDSCDGGTAQCQDYGGVHRNHPCDKTI